MNLTLDSTLHRHNYKELRSNWFFFINRDFLTRIKGFNQVKPSQKTGKVSIFPAFDMAWYFSVNFDSPEDMSSTTKTSLQDINGQTFISNEVTSSIYRYDYQVGFAG